MKLYLRLLPGRAGAFRKMPKQLPVVALGAAVAVLVATAIFLVVPRGSSAASHDDWPTSLHDLQRTAASSDTHVSASNASSLRLAWTFQTGGPIAATPTVTDGVAYFGSWDGYEYAVNAASGTLLWKTYLGITHYNPICIPPVIGVSSPATVDNNVVYLGGGDSYWYALDARTGQILWRLYIGKSTAVGGNYNWAGPLIVNGYAYIGVASLGDCPLVQGKLLEVSLTTHKVVNTLTIVPDGQIGGGIWTSPAYDPSNNTIYASTGTKNEPTQHMAQAILAIDPNTMEITNHWELPNANAQLDSDFGTSTTLIQDSHGRDLLVVTNKNGNAYAFQRSDLAAGPVWVHGTALAGACPTCGSGSVSSGAFGDGRMYLAGGDGLIGKQGYPGTVNALDPATGRVVWQHPATGPVIGALAYANGLVYAGAGSVLEALDASTGQTLYSYDTGAQIYAGPGIADGYLYTGNINGEVFAFHTAATPQAHSSANCPHGTICEDVGAVATTGTQTTNGSVWNLRGSGGGLAGTADSFRFVSLAGATEGNLRVAAEVKRLQATAPDAQAGVMLRQSADAGAPFYAVMIKPGGKLIVQARTRYSANATLVATSDKLGRSPVYVAIYRTGNTLEAATSRDGKTYALVPGSSVELVLPITSLAGVAASSSVNNRTGEAEFDHVSVSASAQPPNPSGRGHCPVGWGCADIGDPLLVGSQAAAGTDLKLRAAGVDIWNNSDQFHFVSKSVPANATVTAKLVTGPGGAAKSGVMFRAGTDADAAYYAAYVGDGKVEVQYRNVSGLGAQQAAETAANLPQFLRIARSGTRFTTYLSVDGRRWSPLSLSTVEIPELAGTILGGIAATSHDAAALKTTVVSAVQVASGAPRPPDECPAGWRCQDIGFPTPAGDQVHAGNGWTLYGGGGDIWDTYDEFHFVSRNLTGDGSLSVQVSAQTDTGAWAKAGPMFRVSRDPQAPYYAVFVTPGHGLAVQWRLAEGASTGQITKPGKGPIFLRVARKGTTLSAYRSSNGTTWALVPGSTVTDPILAGTVLAGLAADSYNAAAANTSTWRNVVFVGTSKRAGLPVPWRAAAVGNPTPAGSASYKNFVFAIKGGGIDIKGSTDQSEYVYQPVDGDGEFIARVTSQTNTNAWARAGIMFKASTASGAPYASVMVTPGNGVRFDSNFVNDVAGSAARFPDAWLKITRQGSLFTGYQSADGTNWREVGQVILNLPLDATVGMFVNAHDGGSALGTATFDNVSFLPSGGGPLPPPWSSTDIGNTGLPGSSSYSKAAGFTVKGAGSDITPGNDEMQFAYRTLTGNGSIVADVTSLDNTDPWARAGLMIRTAPGASAPRVFAAVTPGNGLDIESSQGGRIAGGSYAFPNAWIKLARRGSVISAYSSANGVHWTLDGTAKLAMSHTILVGLFVDAHDRGKALAAAQFASVAVTSG